MKAAMHVSSIGMMDMMFQADGSFVGEFGGHRHTFPPDPDEDAALIGNSHAWLILSHLAGQRMGIERNGEIYRIDLALLGKVGSWRRPWAERMLAECIAPALRDALACEVK